MSDRLPQIHAPHPDAERELAVLKLLHAQETSPQRDIAKHTGMSLGLTNAVLKRLARKGYVTMRKVKGRHMAYAVTPDGVNEIASRTYRYFRRTMEHVSAYRDAVDTLVKDAAARGFTRVVLQGRSDVDFLLEHACAAHGLEYAKTRPGHGHESGQHDDTFFLLGEREARDNTDTHALYLWDYMFEYGTGVYYGNPE